MSAQTPIVLGPTGDLSQMNSTDTIPLSNLGTGTPSAGTFLCGDGTWAGVSPSVTIRSVSTSDTIALGDGVILCTNTITLTLPDVAAAVNKRYEIKNVGTGVVTIVPDSGLQLIDGYTSMIIQYQYSAIGLISNGSTWARL